MAIEGYTYQAGFTHRTSLCSLGRPRLGWYIWQRYGQGVLYRYSTVVAFRLPPSLDFLSSVPASRAAPWSSTRSDHECSKLRVALPSDLSYILSGQVVQWSNRRRVYMSFPPTLGVCPMLVYCMCTTECPARIAKYVRRRLSGELGSRACTALVARLSENPRVSEQPDTRSLGQHTFAALTCITRSVVHQWTSTG